MRTAVIATLIGGAFLAYVGLAQADTSTWALSSGTASWSQTSSWVSGDIANGTDEDARFNTPTAARNIDLNGQFTVAGIEFNNATAVTFTNSIRNFNISGDLLTFDAPGAGPAFITSSGIGVNQNLLRSEMVFADTVVATVSNTAGNASAGALSLTGNVTGPGGFTKAGDGLMTVAFNSGDTGQIKAWQGPTNVNGGRWRTPAGGTNGMLTSSFTVNGGQLTMISPNSSYTFGPGPLNLNGFGPTTGPFASFPGAVRPDSNLNTTITNNVVLQSDASIALFGNSSVLTLPGVISGPGRFFIDIKGDQPENHGGAVVVTGANTYGGGTTVLQAGLRVSGDLATLGLGDVLVDGVTDRGSNKLATGRLEIESGVDNAIADDATVTLTGDDGVAGTPLGGILTLGAGINELVGGLVLGGVLQTDGGTYGSTASGAEHQFNQYFSGTGVLTIPDFAQSGDHNADGKVDAADYVAWRKIPSLFGGDPAGYNTWRENFGEGGPGGGGATGVPEPGTLVLFGPVDVVGIGTTAARA